MQALWLAEKFGENCNVKAVQKVRKTHNENKWKQDKASQQIYLYGKHGTEKP
jgi:hypothetical protein